MLLLIIGCSSNDSKKEQGDTATGSAADTATDNESDSADPQDSATESNSVSTDPIDSGINDSDSQTHQPDTEDTPDTTINDSATVPTDTDTPSAEDSDFPVDTNLDSASDSPVDTSSEDSGRDTVHIDTDLWDTDGDTDGTQFDGQKFRGVHVIDQDYLMIHFVDGEVLFHENTSGPCAYDHCTEPGDNSVASYGDPLNVDVATSTSSWQITSADDAAYESSIEPTNCYRKSKLNGMAQLEWNGSIGDYNYDYTMEHWIYLALPSPLTQGSTYTVRIDSATNTDITAYTFTYDIFNSRSEAVHVNLSGYRPDSAIHAADLYHWMGDGESRDYSNFEGNTVYLYNVDTQATQEVGQVAFWQQSEVELSLHNFTQSSVWNADFTGSYEPGVYRLAIEGVGASQNFVLGETALYEPYRVSTLGFFYMRIGQDSMDMDPVPRRPLWIPGEDPADCSVVVTDMDPYHPDWPGGGDRWDTPGFFSGYVKAGSPENPNAMGGHSDALDWDRHLAHVPIIYDMLLPYILTDGVIGSDSLGIAESGNGIPDIIDEARNEVDFWLSLRYEGGYGHGLSNPDSATHILYQADNTAIAAWANATNAAILAAALEIAGETALAQEYLAAAEEAWTYVSGLSDQMLDEVQNIGTGDIAGRDLRMTAAAWLYHLTGDTDYENVIEEESLVTSGTSEFLTANRNQFYAVAAYLHTDQVIHYPDLQADMRASVNYQAKEKEVAFTESRPSRRSTDNAYGWFHTTQLVLRTILAHSVATSPEDLALFEKALVLEFDWGLGRNPSNMIQMTTASTRLESKRSVENAYTSGWQDGTPGVHPGHTPYMNNQDWGSGMVMDSPSWLTNTLYPSFDHWPAGETYFNTRYVYAHSEFTPQQTMRGKMALYGYLLGMSR